MKDCHVLVVQDDHDVREVLVDLLTEQGFPVTEAENGAAALAKLKAGYRPDVILSDLVMPLMDGYQLKTELQRHPSWASIPLLILTGGDVHDQALAGIEAVLRAPIDPEVLLERVRRVCRRKAANA